MKNVSSQLAALLENESLNLCRLWTITLQTGTTFRFTDLNSNILFNGDVYVSEPGITISAIQTQLNSSPSDATIEFAARNDFISKNSIRRGHLDKAEITIEAIDYFNPGFNSIPLFGGVVADSTVTDAGAVSLEVRGSLFRADVSLVERYSERCRNKFGDDVCGVDVEALGATLTVTAIGARFTFIETTSLSQDDNFFNMGTIRFTTGPSATITYEISRFAQLSDGITQRIGFLLRPAYDIEVGDEAIIFPGCNKQIKSDCLRRYDNVANFRGEPFVPNFTLDAVIDDLQPPERNPPLISKDSKPSGSGFSMSFSSPGFNWRN